MNILRIAKLFLVLFLGITVVACGGAEDRKANYIAEAKERFDERDYGKAKLGFKNAIQIDPKDPEPRIGLAEVLVAEKNWRQAAAQYRGALQADPENNQAAVELGKLYLLARATQEALDQATNVLTRDPENGDALALKAGVLVQQGKRDESHELLKALFERNPSNHDAALLYASSLNSQGDKITALNVLDKAIDLNDNDNDLISMKALIFHSLGKHDKAIELYQALIKNNPLDFSYKLRLAAYLASVDKSDGAEQTLIEYIDADSSNIDARKALVDMLIAQDKLEKAETYLKQYRSDFPKEYDFVIGLARLKLQQEDKDSALELLNNVISNDPKGPYGALAEFEIAKLDLGEGKLEAVKNRLNSILATHSTNNAALMLRGRIALQEQRNTDAINDFRSVLASDPDDADVVRSLAQAHFQAKEYELAENYFKQLAHRFPKDPIARAKLATLYQSQNELGKAIALREEIEKIVPENSSNLIELAKLYISVQAMPKVKPIAEKLLKLGNSVASGHYFLGLYHQSEGNHELALKQLDRSLSETPTAIEPVSAKVKSLMFLERRDDAIVFLNQLIQDNINANLANNLLGELFIFDKQYQKARDHLTRSISLNKDWIVPRKNLALSYRQEGRIDDAIASLEAALVDLPEAMSLRVELAQLYEFDNKIDAAIEQYEILTQVPDVPIFAANNLAMLLVTYKDDVDSLQKAIKVAEALRGQNHPNYLDTLGWVYYKNEQYDLALPLIKAAAEKAPSNPQINFHLGSTYKATSDFEKARKYFERALESDTNFVGRKEAEDALAMLDSQG